MMHATSDSSGDVGADDEQQHNKPMSQNSALNGIKHDETTDLEDEFTLEHFRHLERTSVAQNFSAVLNDPRVSATPSLFDSLFGEALPTEDVVPTKSTILEDVPTAYFNPYVDEISKLHTIFLENQERLQTLDQTQKHNTLHQNVDPVLQVIEHEGVPEIFFTEEFSLANQDIFNQLFPENVMGTSSLLQEKLTHYLDKVELCILNQVNLRSTNIFDALMQYHELNQELITGLPLVKQLRDRIHDTKNNVVINPMGVVQKHRQSNRLRKLDTLVDRIKDVNNSLKLIKTLNETGDYTNALQLIDTISQVINQEKELSRLHCFKHVPDQLRQERVHLERSMQNDFIQIVTSLNADLQIRLTPLLAGLVRISSSQWNTLLSGYRESLSILVKDTVKSILEEQIGVGAEEEKKNLSQVAVTRLQNLPATQYNILIQTIFEALYQIIYQTHQVRDVIHQYCNRTMTLQFLRQEMDKILEIVCETSHSKCSTIMATRDDDVKKMAKEDIIEYMKAPLAFLKKCETLLPFNKRVNVLRGIMTSQGQLYLDEFNKTRIRSLKLLLQQEKWGPVDTIPQQYQAYINQFVQGQPIIQEAAKEKKPIGAYLQIGDHQFLVCTTLLQVIKMVTEYNEMFSEEYQHFILPLDLSNRLFKFINYFNNEMKELVLGAKAINNTTKLKSITAKHLLLSSECLNCLIHFVPYLRTSLTQQLESPKQHQTFLRQFDAFVQDCIDHRQKIFDKLFDIMTDVLENHTRRILSFNWNGLGEMDKGPLFDLTLDLARLQKAVVDYLEKHVADLQGFFGKVLKMYVERLCTTTKSVATEAKPSLTTKGRMALKKELAIVRNNMEKWVVQCHISPTDVNVAVLEEQIK